MRERYTWKTPYRHRMLYECTVFIMDRETWIAVCAHRLQR
jgi:hypothetical protein